MSSPIPTAQSKEARRRPHAKGPTPPLLTVTALIKRLLLRSAAVLVVLAPLTALDAQLPKIFVASFGNDANDGSRANPKRNFQPAHEAVAAGGEIVVLDTAGYGTLNISKSLAVTVPTGVNGFITTGAGVEFGVTIAAGATSSVSLQGLIVERLGANTSSFAEGINATSVGKLTLKDCTVRGFTIGIFVKPTNSANVIVDHCNVRDGNLTGSGNVGMDFENDTDNTRSVYVVTGCRLQGAGSFGIDVFNSRASSVLDVTLDGCLVTGTRNSQNPSVAPSIFASGPSGSPASTVVRVSNCVIVDNGSGATATNAQLLTRSNNTYVQGALSFPGTYSAK